MTTFSDEVILDALKSEKYGPRLNDIKNEVYALTSESVAIAAEIGKMRDTGALKERVKRAIRVSNLESRMKKMQRQGDKLETEWNSIMRRYDDETHLKVNGHGQSTR